MLKFELVTLDGIKFSEKVYEVILPTSTGHIAVFTHHSPLVSLAVPGIISVRRKEKDPDDFMEFFATNGGVVDIENNVVRVLVDEADREDEINEKEAEDAFKRAQKLRSEAKDQVSIDKAQNLVDRHGTRLRVAEIRRKRRRHR